MPRIATLHPARDSVTRPVPDRRGPPIPRGVRVSLLAFVAVAVAYAAGAELSYGPFGAGAAPAFFPPAGISLAALVLLRRRHWPAVVLAVFVAEIAVDLRNQQPLVLAVDFAVANAAEALVGASLYLYWNGRTHPQLNTRRGIATFSLSAMVVGPIVGASLGTAAQLINGRGGDIATIFGLWWTGDSLGVLVVGATILAWRRGAEPRMGTVTEWGAILAGVMVLSLAQFVTGARPLAYLPMVALFWAGLRLGVRGVLLGGLGMAVVSDLLTAQGYGPWPAVGGSPAVGLVYLKLFLAIAITSAWLLAVEVAGRRRAEQQIEAERADREADAAVEARFVRLRVLTAALSGATTRDAVALAWRTHATSALGGTGQLYVIDGQGMRLIAQAGTHPGVQVDAAADLAQALGRGDGATGRATFATHGAVVAPLIGRRGPVGLLRITPPAGGQRDAAELETVTAVVDRVSDALERVRLLTAANEAGERLGALQRLTSRLGAARTIDEVAAVTVRGMPQAVGARAAGLLVVERGGRALRAVDQTGALPPVWLVGDGDPGGGASRGVVGEVARGGPARYFSHEPVAGDGTEPVPGSGGGQWAVLPIRGGGKLQGVLWLGFDAAHVNVAAERHFLDAVATQCGLMLRRVFSTASEHEAAVKLQQALLPHHFPAVVGMAAAARYLAASEGLSVGGDWYDIVARRDGRTVAVIGDVVGHDVGAAAAMGQLRSAVSVVAVEAEGPADAFGRLDGFPGGSEIGFATACYVDYQSSTGQLRYALAGHPSPLLMGPSGETAYLAGGRSKPLFAVRDAVRIEADTVVADGSRLVCFTDGLIERREHSLAAGFDELDRVCRSKAALPLAAFTDAVLEEMTRGVTRTDDVAMLCLQLSRHARS